MSTTPTFATAPLFRLWNGKDHLYTTTCNEKGTAQVQGGYHIEGIMGFVAKKKGYQTTALYRLFNGTDHLYTIDAAERDSVIKNNGYKSEGITGHVSINRLQGTVPLYRMYNPGNGDHFYTIDPAEQKRAQPEWQPEGKMGYVWKKGQNTCSRFPQRLDRYDDLGSHDMATTVIISSNGRFDMITDTRNKISGSGSCGVIILYLFDKKRNIIDVRGGQRYCVDGKLFPGAGPSFRRDNWSFKVSPDVLNRVNGVAIVHRDASKPVGELLGNNLKTVNDILQSCPKCAQAAEAIVTALM